MRSQSVKTLRVEAHLKWRRRRVRRWSGTLSITYGRPGDPFETLALEPQGWDGAATWRSFTRDGVVRKLRHYCERQGHVVDWKEVLC